MKTVITESPEIAAEFIRAGELVAFPTETVYGLGADIFNAAAIAKIFEAKGRPKDNPLIAHICDLADLALLASQINEAAERLIERFFPGPLTLVLPKHPRVPSIATTGLRTIGVRMPGHGGAIRFIRACGVPLVAPSANLSGRPSPTTWEAVESDLDGRIACILKGAPAIVGLESTVVDCTSGVPVVLRAGAVSLEELREEIPEIRLIQVTSEEPARSPGMKYKHYSPSARVVITRADDVSVTGNSAFIGLHTPGAHLFVKTLICSSVEEYARALFDYFRQCDAAGIAMIYCEGVSEEGLGLALMDRIRRAASN